MILRFSAKILRKEKGKLFLPFLSILLTSCVVVLSYLLISSTSSYLSAKDKEFIGGDVSVESNVDFDMKAFFDEENLSVVTELVNFQGLVSNGERASGASFTFVDDEYPLYGKILLRDGEYAYPAENEMYADENLGRSLDLEVGDIVEFNDKDFRVKGIVTQFPEALLGGFSFSPKVILAKEAIAYGGVDLSLFRKEFRKKAILKEDFDKQRKMALRESARKEGARVNFEGGGESGPQFGLEVVEDFLIVVIIVVIVLALVNVYSSVSFLADRLRRVFAILMSLGLNAGSVSVILLLVNSVVISAGIFFGSASAFIVNAWIGDAVADNFRISLERTPDVLQVVSIIALIYITSLFATLPVVGRLKSLSPKELLINSRNKEGDVYRNVFRDILIGLFPVALISIYFLDSILYGSIIVGAIILTFGLVMILYSLVVRGLYRVRSAFPFFLRLIVAQKKFDGYLGLVTFASLFVALTAVYNLSILRTSVDGYLRGDLRGSIPSVYVLDLQKSQIGKFKDLYPESTLFPNVRARLVSVDGLDVQKELEKEKPKLDREFAREFNLTYRTNLLEGEEVLRGRFEGIRKGEVSLEEDFAERLGADLGSTLVLNIQGFDLAVEVTSLRKVDTRSGLPFFFLVFSPEDLEKYPNTSFGYLDIPPEDIGGLSKKLSEDFPNVSLIDTGRVADITEDIIGLLLVVILVITVPPIALSTLLIINIIAILSQDRKRDGARLMALGKTKGYLRNFFIFESTITLVLSSVGAYVFAFFVSNYLIVRFLEIGNVVYFDAVSFFIFATLLVGIIAVSLIIWSKGKRSIKDYLNYEENS